MKGNLRERLYQLETPPPVDVWERIAQTLDESDERKAPVIPLQPVKKYNWLKVALAASFIGFVVMTGLWYAERGKKAEKIIVRENGTPTRDTLKEPGTQNTTAQVTEPPANDNNAGNNNRDNSSNNSINNTTAGNNNGTQVQNKTPQQKGDRLPVTNERNIVTQKDPSPLVAENKNLPKVVARDSSGKVILDINEIQSANETTLTGPVTAGDKSIARILSKISANGDDEELDRVIKDSPYWKNKIQEWRNKLIRSGYTPSAVNLMDLPALLKILQEEKTP
jgi:hypothetical protein